MFRAAARGRLPKMQDLLNDEELLRLRQSIQAWRTGPQPAIVTHDLWDDAGDPILRHYRHRGLFNGPEDPVKVIFHPEFVTATSPLFNLDYQQFVRGCHMGIFPSYYEPWGYTPMECVALGLPAVTTDLSGFGAYVQHHVPNAAHQGICVLNRRTRGFEETTSNLVDYLMAFAQMNRRQRIRDAEPRRAAGRAVRLVGPGRPLPRGPRPGPGARGRRAAGAGTGRGAVRVRPRLVAGSDAPPIVACATRPPC